MAALHNGRVSPKLFDDSEMEIDLLFTLCFCYRAEQSWGSSGCGRLG